jgi:hypothetical protein
MIVGSFRIIDCVHVILISLEDLMLTTQRPASSRVSPPKQQIVGTAIEETTNKFIPNVGRSSALNAGFNVNLPGFDLEFFWKRLIDMSLGPKLRNRKGCLRQQEGPG